MITKQISFTQIANKLAYFPKFSNALDLTFQEEAKRLYKDGKTVSLDVAKTPIGVRMRVSFRDPIAYYLPFLEWGTGRYMADWWKPFAEQGAAYPGMKFARKPRGDEKIRPRGRGNKWINFAKKGKYGSRALHTPQGWRAKSEGAHGKHRLQMFINTFLSKMGTGLAMRKVFQEIEKGCYV